MKLPLLYLASESPRRKQLLEALGLSFKVMRPSGDEDVASVSDIDEITLRNAVQKASSIVVPPDDVALGADTLVALDDVVLGKPHGVNEAKAMLAQLSGKKQTVVTGIAFVSKKYGTMKRAVRSHVTFRKLSSQEIDEYCMTKEPYDKAGAYAVQGMASLFIEKIEGSYSNVMGLPIEALLEELSELTSIPVFQWFLNE